MRVLHPFLPFRTPFFGDTLYICFLNKDDSYRTRPELGRHQGRLHFINNLPTLDIASPTYLYHMAKVVYFSPNTGQASSKCYLPWSNATCPDQKLPALLQWNPSSRDILIYPFITGSLGQKIYVCFPITLAYKTKSVGQVFKNKKNVHFSHWF